MRLTCEELCRLGKLAEDTRKDLREVHSDYAAGLVGLASAKTVAVLRAIENAVAKCDAISLQVTRGIAEKGGR